LEEADRNESNKLNERHKEGIQFHGLVSNRWKNTTEQWNDLRLVARSDPPWNRASLNTCRRITCDKPWSLQKTRIWITSIISCYGVTSNFGLYSQRSAAQRDPAGSKQHAREKALTRFGRTEQPRAARWRKRGPR